LRWHRDLMKHRHARTSVNRGPGRPRLDPPHRAAPGSRETPAGATATHPRRTRPPAHHDGAVHSAGASPSRGNRAFGCPAGTPSWNAGSRRCAPNC
jgi:hypothetical protein